MFFSLSIFSSMDAIRPVTALCRSNVMIGSLHFQVHVHSEVGISTQTDFNLAEEILHMKT